MKKGISIESKTIEFISYIQMEKYIRWFERGNFFPHK